ncbi:hypothetical protein PAPYR_7018 [Paratrimastix pyriformis]|uniref:Uncharacterized protein n=1 Tax=Paratrimastix pyriformis TaxID=342808 RepID=A0ABQ8UE29_9EUKA|nr:hypothetical protein PAPYR_7018 [Paratrimastix pyriformis]
MKSLFLLFALLGLSLAAKKSAPAQEDSGSKGGIFESVAGDNPFMKGVFSGFGNEQPSQEGGQQEGGGFKMPSFQLGKDMPGNDFDPYVDQSQGWGKANKQMPQFDITRNPAQLEDGDFLNGANPFSSKRAKPEQEYVPEEQGDGVNTPKVYKTESGDPEGQREVTEDPERVAQLMKSLGMDDSGEQAPAEKPAPAPKKGSKKPQAQPVAAPAPKRPVKKAPKKQAPVEEAPQEEAPQETQEAPQEEAPVTPHRRPFYRGGQYEAPVQVNERPSKKQAPQRYAVRSTQDRFFPKKKAAPKAPEPEPEPEAEQPQEEASE